ncbi:MAG: TRAP transporter small permease subunit [Planctomycetota bacterium]|jgi:TRAP-type C4-dicarboxylate transport system permease small subunit|nr:TRAP transporter small permease subunit [Planctomycetota bacterium]
MFFRICAAYAKFLHVMVFVMGCTLIFSVGLQVAGRYVPFIPPYLWTLEVTNFALIWAIFIGSILGIRYEKHFVVDIFEMGGKKINPKLNFYLRILNNATALAITGVFIRYGWEYFVKWGMIQTSDITGVNLGWLYASVPFAGVSWLLFIAENFLKEFVVKPGVAARS